MGTQDWPPAYWTVNTRLRFRRQGVPIGLRPRLKARFAQLWAARFGTPPDHVSSGSRSLGGEPCCPHVHVELLDDAIEQVLAEWAEGCGTNRRSGAADTGVPGGAGSAR